MADKKILKTDNQEKIVDEILKDEELEKVTGGTSVVAGESSHYSPNSNEPIGPIGLIKSIEPRGYGK